MAATTDEMKAPEKTGFRAELWALAGVAGVALLCMGVLAGALALILGKGSRIQVNSVIGGGSVYAPPATPGPGEGNTPLTGPPGSGEGGAWLAREEPPPSTLAGPSAGVRALAPSSNRPFPQAFSAATGPGGWIARTPAFASQAAPPASGAAYVPPVLAGSEARTSVPFEVRGDSAVFSVGNQVLPMPVRHAHVHARRPVPERGDLRAASGPAAAPVPAQEDGSSLALSGPSAREAEASVPAAPAGSYAGAPVRGSRAEMSLLGARSTASLPGYHASPGNLFFTARVLVRNLGTAPLAVGGDAFDLDDADGASYMAMPAPASAPLAAGTQARRTLTFLVPQDAVLSTLSLVLPSETDPITLSQP